MYNINCQIIVHKIKTEYHPEKTNIKQKMGISRCIPKKNQLSALFTHRQILRRYTEISRPRQKEP